MNKHLGSKFDDFLQEENLLDEVNAQAIKRVLAFQLAESIKRKHLSKSRLAKEMRTSRSSLDRLFDPNNSSITLKTLVKAARIIGRKIDISLR